MFTPENLRTAWENAFGNMTIYGDYSVEIEEEISYIANDEVVDACQRIEAIYAEDDEDWNDQAEEIVNEMLEAIKSLAEDRIGNGFGSDLAESKAIYRADNLEYFQENTSECEDAFFEATSMSECSSITDAIGVAVYLHICRVAEGEMIEAIEMIPDLEDEMIAELQA